MYKQENKTLKVWKFKIPMLHINSFRSVRAHCIFKVASLWSHRIRSSTLQSEYKIFHETSVLEAPYPLVDRSNLLLLWRIKSFKLRPLKCLRPSRLQFSTNSCVFFLALFRASFPSHFYRSFRRQFVCFACLPVVYLPIGLPLISLPFLALFTVSLPMFFVLLRSLLYICRLPTFPICPTCFCSHACYLSRACTQFCSARNVGWEAKEILLHFIPQTAISRARKPRSQLSWAEKPERSFMLNFP